jgi:threonyl-tRNA synthetase
MRQVLKKNNVDFYEAKGEAVFYGPKIDVQAVNVFGKEDSIGTNQIDFNLPERFDLTYIDKDGQKQRPYVLHRALIGSFERFFAFLIEYYAGNFPLWFAPKQVMIIPVSEKFIDYAEEVNKALKTAGDEHNLWIRSEIDNRNETLQSRIRDAAEMKLPYVLIVGNREQENNQVSVRIRVNGDIGTLPLDEFIEKFITEIKQKKLESVFN